MIIITPGLEVIKLLSCSTQQSTKFELLINIKKAKSMEISGLNHQSRLFILQINVKMPTMLNANNCWHFNIYEQDKFHAQLTEFSMKKSFITLGPV